MPLVLERSNAKFLIYSGIREFHRQLTEMSPEARRLFPVHDATVYGFKIERCPNGLFLVQIADSYSTIDDTDLEWRVGSGYKSDVPYRLVSIGSVGEPKDFVDEQIQRLLVIMGFIEIRPDLRDNIYGMAKSDTDTLFQIYLSDREKFERIFLGSCFH